MVATNTIHEIGIANQIGRYSDGVEVTNSRRLLFVSGTPGLATHDHLSNVFEEQAKQASKNVLALLKSAGMGISIWSRFLSTSCGRKIFPAIC
jgi:2-iminobutanoate/2-iminopropanoate deaminase